MFKVEVVIFMLVVAFATYLYLKSAKRKAKEKRENFKAGNGVVRNKLNKKIKNYEDIDDQYK